MDAELRRKIAALLVVRASGHLLDDQRGYPRWELDNARCGDCWPKGWAA